MEKLSKEDEKHIMRALEKAVDMTNSGTHPNDAITKAATEYRFGPPIVQRMVEAFNVSKTLSHMKNASGGSRADSFPLADAVAIISKMYPEDVTSPAEKQAAEYVPSEYKRKEEKNFNKIDKTKLKIPDVKKASAYNRDPNALFQEELAATNYVKRAADHALTANRNSFFRVLDLAKQAGLYFKNVSHTPFATVEQQVYSVHGELGKQAMDMIYKLGGLKEKRAELKLIQVVVDERREPFNKIAALIKESQTFNDTLDMAADAVSLHDKVDMTKTASAPKCLLDDLCEDSFNTASQVSASDSPRAKAAGFGEMRENVEDLASAGLNVMGIQPMDANSARRKAMQDVMDPEHEARMDSIKTKAMLNDFVANDPVLSTYDPQEVFSAFNQISTLAPSVSQQPPVMRGLLRRMLQSEGLLEPHEADQVSKIDMNLRGQNPELASILGGSGGDAKPGSGGAFMSSIFGKGK